MSSTRHHAKRYLVNHPSTPSYLLKVLFILLMANMILTFLSRLWSFPNLPPPPPPEPVLTMFLQQQRDSVLITVGRCNFTSKAAILCYCTSGFCLSELDGKGLGGWLCKECGHAMSLHCNYGKNLTLKPNIFY